MEIVISICSLAAALFLLLFARLIYRTAYPKRVKHVKSGAGEAQRPEDLGWPCESLVVCGHDGNRIKGWVVDMENPRAIILLLHGHRKNKTQMLGRARFLRAAGYALVFIDHRHHGESDDFPFGLGYFGRLDLAKVVEHLKTIERFKGLPIGALGLSLGATTALVATLDGVDISALVADSPTSDQAKTLAEYAKRLYWFPQCITMAGLSFAEWWWSMDYEKMNLEERLVGCEKPILIIHGDEDKRVPIHHARRLASIKTKSRLELEVFEGADHVESYTTGKKRYERKVLQFFNDTL